MRTSRTVYLTLSVVLFTLCIWTPLAFAQWPASDSTSAIGSVGTDALWSSLGRLAIALVVVVVLIWGTLWVAKRLMSGRLTGRLESPMRIVERLHLAPKRSVDIVSIGDRILVLGVTESSISMLTELSPDDLATKDAFAKALNQQQAQTTSRRRDLINHARHKLNDLFRAARMTEKEAVPDA